MKECVSGIKAESGTAVWYLSTAFCYATVVKTLHKYHAAVECVSSQKSGMLRAQSIHKLGTSSAVKFMA